MKVVLVLLGALCLSMAAPATIAEAPTSPQGPDGFAAVIAPVCTSAALASLPNLPGDPGLRPPPCDDAECSMSCVPNFGYCNLIHDVCVCY